MARHGPTWALPPRPPDAWQSPVWTPLLAAALGVIVLAPLLLGLPTTPTERVRVLLSVLAAAGAAVAARSMLIEHVVRGVPRLRWMAVGYAVTTALLLGTGLDLGATAERRLTVLALAAPAAFAVTSALARRPVAVVVPLAALVALGTLVMFASAGAAGAVTAAAGSFAGALWWARVDRRTAVISVGLLLDAGAGLLLAGGSAQSRPSTGALWVVAAGAAVPGAWLGLTALTGFGRQSARWHRLEREVVAVRTGSPLMPGRSVIPDDDEGLPPEPDVLALIESGVVRIAIQPVVELSTGRVVGQEALSRFGGRVPTDRWFKAASRYALGGPLEQLTVRRALEVLALLPPEQFLAVNVSPAALHDAAVIALLAESDLQRVVVEITEHEAVADYPVVRRILHRLRKAGARIAVDDTGAGFASLRHVLMLQPDLIKLDTSLTRRIEADEQQQDLVRAVTRFASQVGARVLAEGIEEQAQLEALQDIGVELGQGWHLGVPAFPSGA